MNGCLTVAVTQTVSGCVSVCVSLFVGESECVIVGGFRLRFECNVLECLNELAG